VRNGRTTAYCPLCKRHYPFDVQLWLDVSRRVNTVRFYEVKGFAWLRWQPNSD
jgi:hypothetical protein